MLLPKALASSSRDSVCVLPHSAWFAVSRLAFVLATTGLLITLVLIVTASRLLFNALLCITFAYLLDTFVPLVNASTARVLYSPTFGSIVACRASLNERVG